MGNKARAIMAQGTASGVGKSIMVAALCRLFARRGVKVAPFKAQNMALNSYVTADGKEIGRSTAVQAFAAGLTPSVEMNPILLKPKGDAVSQLIVHGAPVRDVAAKEFFADRSALATLKRKAVRSAWGEISGKYDLVVIEGAGSPAEINLRKQDTVNMAMAKLAGAKVILIADIDKGGAFASLYGTYRLLTPSERERIGAFLLNKFRGDSSLLEPAIDKIARKTGVPFIGVVPFIPDIGVQEEDAVPELEQGDPDPDIVIGIVYLPHISNFTDLDPLAWEPGVRLRYVKYPNEMKGLDAVILPGTKNAIYDILRIREVGLDKEIYRLKESGVPVIGVCGGYQLLGKRLIDEDGLEDPAGTQPGLGLLPVETEFKPGKILKRTKLNPCGLPPMLANADSLLEGYEIHSGRTTVEKGAKRAFRVVEGDDEGEGCVSDDGMVFGTYLHGLFEKDGFRRDLVDSLRKLKGLKSIDAALISSEEKRAEAFDRLADVVSESVDIGMLEGLCGMEGVLS